MEKTVSWRRTPHPIVFAGVIACCAQAVCQVGIKEIYHEHWQRLFEVIPNIKVIITCRDPRDIYISLIEMRRYCQGSKLEVA
jgi:hypothetical protein